MPRAFLLHNESTEVLIGSENGLTDQLAHLVRLMCSDSCHGNLPGQDRPAARFA
jgi:hypothetical protein